MQCDKPRITPKTILLPIVGLVAFFLFILLFNVDILKIVETARRANPIIYLAAMVVSLAEVFFAAACWRSILGNLQVRISIARSNLFVWYGTFIDIIIPAESLSGELCRVYLVNREQCGTSGKVVASLIVQRLLGMGMNVVFLVAGVSLLSIDTQVDPTIFYLILFFTIAIATMMAVLLIVCVKEKWMMKVLSSIIRIAEFLTRGKWKRLTQIKEEAFKNAKIFNESMSELIRKPQALLIPGALLMLNWICSLSVPYLVFLSLGVQVPWSVVLITGSIVVAVKAIPIGVPFEIGLPEITMTTLYVSMGVPADISAAATVLSRILTLWLRFGIGFVAQQWIEAKLAFKPKVASSPKNPKA